MAVNALCFLLALSCCSAASRDVPTEIFDNVAIAPEQLRRAEIIAKKANPGEIERIAVGQLAHPLPWMGARFYFKPDIVETYVIQRIATVQFEYEDREIPGPKTVAESRQLVPVGDFKLLCVNTVVKRLFQLKERTLYVVLPDEMSYSQALSLLKAIEIRNYSTREGVRSNDVPIDVSKIITLRFEIKSGRVEVRTAERRFEGKVAVFIIGPDGFELIDVGRWVS